MKLKLIFIFSIFLISYINPIRLAAKEKIESNLNDAIAEKEKKDGDTKTGATTAEPAEGEKKEGEAKTEGAPAEGEKKEGEGKNTTATVGAQGEIKELEIITQPPFNISHIAQVIQYEGNTLANPEDYTTYNKPAFFTLSVVMVNMFESKTSHNLLESINIAYLSEDPHILLGSTKCIIFEDTYSKRNITLCTKSPEEANQLIEAFKILKKLRATTIFNDKDPNEGRIVRASCNGIKDPNGKTYDFLETQQFFKKHLEEKGIEISNAQVDPNQILKIKDYSEKIRASKFVPPGSEREVKKNFYELKVPQKS